MPRLEEEEEVQSRLSLVTPNKAAPAVARRMDGAPRCWLKEGGGARVLVKPFYLQVSPKIWGMLKLLGKQ